MKKAIYYIKFSIIGMLIWSVLNENVSVKILLTGLLMGFLATMFANYFLSSAEIKRNYTIKLPALAVFIFVLLFRIFKAGIQVIPYIFKKKPNTGIIDIKTDVPEGLATTILANSITLTPGTVTINKKGKLLKVLWLDKITDDSAVASRAINGGLENILKKAIKYD